MRAILIVNHGFEQLCRVTLEAAAGRGAACVIQGQGPASGHRRRLRGCVGPGWQSTGSNSPINQCASAQYHHPPPKPNGSKPMGHPGTHPARKAWQCRRL